MRAVADMARPSEVTSTWWRIGPARRKPPGRSGRGAGANQDHKRAAGGKQQRLAAGIREGCGRAEARPRPRASDVFAAPEQLDPSGAYRVGVYRRVAGGVNVRVVRSEEGRGG